MYQTAVAVLIILFALSFFVGMFYGNRKKLAIGILVMDSIFYLVAGALLLTESWMPLATFLGALSICALPFGSYFIGRLLSGRFNRGAVRRMVLLSAGPPPFKGLRGGGR